MGPSWFPPTARCVQSLSLVCWCISTSTVAPAGTAHFASAGVLRLHAIDVAFTFIRGELDVGVLIQVLAWSTPLTHSCWNIPCAVTLDTAARVLNIADANFILETENDDSEVLLLLLHF